MDDIAPMVLGVTFFVMSGAVLILRPISKRLGAYLEILASERRTAQPSAAVDDGRLSNVLDSLDQRMRRLEERQAFTDALLAGRKPGELPAKSE